MADATFKVSDVKSLKELAHVLTYPIISVAYFLQSGPNISLENQFHYEISQNLTQSQQLALLLLIFAAKTLFICIFVGIFDVLITFWDGLDVLLTIASVIFIAFGIMGLFANSAHPLLKEINNFWFIASLVWGFACSGRIEKKNESKTSKDQK
jgi:hypothetical protein